MSDHPARGRPTTRAQRRRFANLLDGVFGQIPHAVGARAGILKPTQIVRKPKVHRRNEAREEATKRLVQRLYSPSVAIMRSDAAWEKYHEDMTKVIESGASDDELIAAINPQVWKVENNDFVKSSALLTMHLALLYTVVEGWRKWRFKDAEVDELLKSPFVAELKAYRHAIFHANEFNAKAIMQFTADPDRTKWVTALSNGLRRALREHFANLPDKLVDYLDAEGIGFEVEQSGET